MKSLNPLKFLGTVLLVLSFIFINQNFQAQKNASGLMMEDNKPEVVISNKIISELNLTKADFGLYSPSELILLYDIKKGLGGFENVAPLIRTQNPSIQSTLTIGTIYMHYHKINSKLETSDKQRTLDIYNSAVNTKMNTFRDKRSEYLIHKDVKSKNETYTSILPFEMQDGKFYLDSKYLVNWVIHNPELASLHLEMLDNVKNDLINNTIK